MPAVLEWRSTVGTAARRLTRPFARHRFVLQRAFTLAIAVAASAGVPRALHATPVGGTPMPWVGPLTILLEDLSGPTARVIGALAFVIGGALWAFTRHEEGARRFGQAIVGIAIMIGAANIVTLLAFSGATV